MCMKMNKEFKIDKYNWDSYKGLIYVTLSCEQCEEECVYVMNLTDKNLCALMNNDYGYLKDYFGL